MRLLSNQENFGCLSGPGGGVHYLVSNAAPRRVRRAVALVNYADNVAGEGFTTYEDRPVTWSKNAMLALLLLVVGTPLAMLMYWMGDRNFLFLIGIPVLGVVFLNLAPQMLGSHETACGFLAARIFGAPCYPRHYLAVGERKGWVRQQTEADSASSKPAQ
jgi:hypothetical protein